MDVVFAIRKSWAARVNFTKRSTKYCKAGFPASKMSLVCVNTEDGAGRVAAALSAGMGHGRYARNDFSLGDYFLPARTTVLISQFVTHRDPRYFPDPLAFRSRSILDRRQSPATRNLLTFPFGAGARQCIENHLPGWKGVLILATLAQKWKLQIGPRSPG